MNLKAIRERVDKAASGPWTASQLMDTTVKKGHKRTISLLANDEFGYFTNIDHCRNTDFADANADFIAHARQDLPDLLDAFEEAYKLVKELHFQFEPLVQSEAEEHFLDDDVEAEFIVLLDSARAFLAKHKPEKGEE